MEQLIVDVLNTNLTRLPAQDRSFAQSLVTYFAKHKKLSEKQMYWAAKLADKVNDTAPPAPQVPAISPPVAPVGSMAGVIQLFKAAKKHLAHPQIRLKLATGAPLVLKLAGPKSKAAGSINLTDGGSFHSNVWYGRVSPEGALELRDSVPDGVRVEIRRLLMALATDPSDTAAKHGKLEGRCCFCWLPLSDPKSTAVGYGKTCAKHFGLPWGAA